MKNKLDSYVRDTLLSTIFEASIVFVILSVALILQFDSRNILNNEILKSVFEKSLFLAVTYVLVFKVAKRGIFIITDFAFHSLRKNEHQSPKIWTFLTNVFSALSIILISVPVRPILQKVNLQTESPIFDEALVKFDAIQSVLILAVIGVPMIIYSYLKFEGTSKTLNILGVIGAMTVAGILNNKPNYQARVYETRADWITKDWQKQEEDAKKALRDAKTNQEKATSYYWLGVSAGRQGRYEENIEYQKKALELAPDYGAPHSSLSLMYLALRDLDNAKFHAEECIRLDPKYAWCYYAMAGYMDNSGDKKGAFDNLSKALRLDPYNTEFQEQMKTFNLQNPDIN